MYITFMPFYPKKKKNDTFKNGILDYIVICIVFVVFIYAFFFDSFIPLTYENGTEVYSEQWFRETGDGRIPKINMFALIGGLIMTYEIFLLTFEGKKRGRALPWLLWYGLLIYAIQMKIKEGKDQTREYFEEKRKRKR